MADMRLIVAGAGGRMGRTLVKAIAETPGLDAGRRHRRRGLAAARAGLRRAGGLAAEPRECDQRSAPRHAGGRRHHRFHRSGRDRAARGARGRNRSSSHIIGTTGLSAADDAKIAEAAKKTAIMKSGNMSLGVNLLAVLAKQVAQALGEEFDIEIFEMHHNKKIDAPSGTALLFGEAAAAGRKIDLKERSERGRDGHTGARKAGDIGFASLRGGTVAGEHHVIFAGPAERIELHPQGRGPHDLRARRAQGRAVGARPRAGALFDAGCAGIEGLNDDLTAFSCSCVTARASGI